VPLVRIMSQQAWMYVPCFHACMFLVTYDFACLCSVFSVFRVFIGMCGMKWSVLSARLHCGCNAWVDVACKQIQRRQPILLSPTAALNWRPQICAASP